MLESLVHAACWCDRLEQTGIGSAIHSSIRSLAVAVPVIRFFQDNSSQYFSCETIFEWLMLPLR